MGRCSYHSDEAIQGRAELVGADKAQALIEMETAGSFGEVARRIGVARQTLAKWRSEDPVSAVQLEDAKDVALDSVVACLLKRGTEGQEVVEETAERVPVRDADGAVVGYEFVVTKRVTKRIVDTSAAQLVLASARPEFRSMSSHLTRSGIRRSQRCWICILIRCCIGRSLRRCGRLGSVATPTEVSGQSATWAAVKARSQTQRRGCLGAGQSPSYTGGPVQPQHRQGSGVECPQARPVGG